MWRSAREIAVAYRDRWKAREPISHAIVQYTIAFPSFLALYGRYYVRRCELTKFPFSQRPSHWAPYLYYKIHNLMVHQVGTYRWAAMALSFAILLVTMLMSRDRAAIVLALTCRVGGTTLS